MYKFICMRNLIHPMPSRALVKTWTEPDRTGSVLEVYRMYLEEVNYQCTTMLTHGADSYTKIMPCFSKERETSVRSCTSIVLFQGPRPASRCLQYSPAHTASDGKLPGNKYVLSQGHSAASKKLQA